MTIGNPGGQLLVGRWLLVSEAIDSVGHCVVRGARGEAICHRCRSAVSRLHFLIVAWGLYLLVCL